MTHLEVETQQLNKAILEMMQLVQSQLEKAKEAFINMDSELAQEVIHNEKRVNAMELSIDRSCENILALFNPLATDLRFVVAVLKINSDVERIGDYADGIADYVVDHKVAINNEMREATRLKEMFEIALSMTRDIIVAFETEDTTLARKVYKKDNELNAINKDTSAIISRFVINDPETIRQALFLFSTIQKLERVGDHVKNIAEEIIFYIEAKVLKHKKMLKEKG